MTRHMECDVVCQVITLLNIPTGQAISLLLTHIVWGMRWTRKIRPSVYVYVSPLVSHISPLLVVFATKGL